VVKPYNSVVDLVKASYRGGLTMSDQEIVRSIPKTVKKSITVKFDPLVCIYIEQMAEKLGVSTGAFIEIAVKEKLVDCGVTAWRDNVEKKLYT
jgi:hypothetical protein